MSTSNPFLIVGTGSSGSHLLSILLDKHRKLACGPELGIFDKPIFYEGIETLRESLSRWFEKGASTDGWFNYQHMFKNLDCYFTDRKDIRNYAQNVESLRQFVDAFFGPYLEQRNKPRWGEQTLTNVYCIEKFLALYPKARIIHLVRDGRDVMCSLMKRGFPAYAAAGRWLYDVAAATRFRGRPWYMEVRYRDLVTSPEESLREVCRHLGIEYQDVMLDPEVSNEYWATVMASPKAHQSWDHVPSSATISSASVERHRTDLKPQHRRLFWNVILTRWGRRKLQTPYSTTGQLMKVHGFINEAPKTLSSISGRDLLAGARLWVGRNRFELQYEGRIFPPLVRPRFTDIS